MFKMKFLILLKKYYLFLRPDLAIPAVLEAPNMAHTLSRDGTRNIRLDLSFKMNNALYMGVRIEFIVLKCDPQLNGHHSFVYE